ncbi:MAG: GNVR domain-containing protein [bacterium]|nr:GNVR domain-containing protein [bacterium]
MINSFYDLLYLLVKERKKIIYITLAFTVFAAGLSLVIPLKYKATAILMPPVNQGVNLMSLALKGSFTSDPEIGGVGFMPGMVTPSDIFAYMLKSGTIAGIVIDECGLVEHYKKDKVFAKDPQKAMYNVSLKLSKSTAIKVGDERFITITVEDKDKNKAAEIANCYGTALDRVYTNLTMNQGRKAREFIEKRLDQEEVLLKKLEDSLNVFQKRFRTVSLNDEMKAVIEMSAALEGKIVGQRIEMEAMKSYGTAENPQIMSLENQINKAEQQLNELMKGSKNKNLFVPFASAPDIGMELGRRMRDVKIHQEVYGLLVQQLEQAKIMEAKDTPKIQFLERAAPPYKKSWPKRSYILIVGFLMGVISAIAMILMKSWLMYFISNKSNTDKINNLFSLFR